MPSGQGKGGVTIHHERGIFTPSEFCARWHKTARSRYRACMIHGRGVASLRRWLGAMRQTGPARVAEAVRTWGTAAAFATGCALLLRHVDAFYPISKWLFWRYLGYWFAVGCFVFSCFSAGDFVVRRSLGRRLEAAEHVVVAFTVGFVVFGLGVFVAGLMGWFGPAFFFVFPLIVAAPGMTGALTFLVRTARAARERARPRSMWLDVSLAVGVGACVLMYFPTLTPENIAYDVRWYHIPIAEHYVAAGRIARFEEGRLLGAYPQLVTWIYTWALQLPFGRYFDRVLLCAQLEIVAFLMMLAGVPALVRRLAPELSGVRSWLFVFLFPGMFLYDSNLNAGADHFVAAFAVPAWLMLLTVWRSLDVRSGVVFGLVLATVALTKYTAVALIAPILLAFAGRFLWLVGRRALRKSQVPWAALLLGASVPAAVMLAATSAHWLKNWVFYGDPVFPILVGRLAPERWVPELPIHFANYPVVFKPPANWEGVLQTLKVGVNFAFFPNDWPGMHGSVPVFGMVFTLSLLALPFVGASRRVWALVLASELGVLVWYWTNHQDRYLQALVPWFAAVVAAVMGLAFRRGLAARVGAVALCSVQAVWGLDVPFIPTHAMIRDTPIRASAHLFGQGYLRRYDERLRVSPFEDVRAVLPRGSKVLLHNIHVHWGLETESVTDWAPFQGALSYIRLSSPRGVYEKLKSMRVTHLLLAPGADQHLEQDSFGSNLVFWEFVELHTPPTAKTINGFRLIAMPDEAPPAQSPDRTVLYLGCKERGGYASGLFRLADMNQLYGAPFARPFEPAKDESSVTRAQLLARADFVIVNGCRRKKLDPGKNFVRVYQRQDHTFYARRPTAMP